MNSDTISHNFAEVGDHVRSGDGVCRPVDDTEGRAMGFSQRRSHASQPALPMLNAVSHVVKQSA